MFWIPIYISIVIILIYLFFATLYLVFLALAYLSVKDPQVIKSDNLNKFAIVVPAHNEELLISSLCKSLLEINYPKNMYDIFIVADNCNDNTAEICKSFDVNVIERNNISHIGKGYAISWALKYINLVDYDAVFLVDADNIVDTSILNELNILINSGEKAIQCFNTVRNRGDSWFTQLLFVSRTISNLLYHQAKYKLGLSSYLMGNGLCFTSQLLQQRGWSAFSAGEDWEYYAGLVKERIKIGFAVKAMVFHQESRSLNQATSQRLRWSSGRFQIAKKLGLPLFLNGLRNRDWFTLDASLPLVFPNYSLQLNLTLLTLILSLFLPDTWLKLVLIAAGTGLLLGQFFVFVVGVFLAGSVWDVLKAVLHVPSFLVWKMVIDILSLSGIYKGGKWVRTDRHISTSDKNVG
jgi:cellulose synthase/poly-beta-1,6-N-acetylglucosamine synthase-like glycosyltransferase